MMAQTLCTMVPSVGGDHTDVVARYNDAGSPGLQRSAGHSEQTSRRGAEDGTIAAAFNRREALCRTFCHISFGGVCAAAGHHKANREIVGMTAPIGVQGGALSIGRRKKSSGVFAGGGQDAGLGIGCRGSRMDDRTPGKLLGSTVGCDCIHRVPRVWTAPPPGPIPRGSVGAMG